jgi:hypothetical protein
MDGSPRFCRLSYVLDHVGLARGDVKQHQCCPLGRPSIRFPGLDQLGTDVQKAKVTRQGMHAALKRFEAARDRCNLVASEANELADARESIQQPDLQKPLQ